MVDSSNSVDWNRMLTYMRYLVERFYDSLGSNVGFGIMTYADTAKVEMPLNSLSGSKDAKSEILSFIGRITQQTGTSAGFASAMQLVPGFFSPQQGGRIGVRQVNNQILHLLSNIIFS